MILRILRRSNRIINFKTRNEIGLFDAMKKFFIMAVMLMGILWGLIGCGKQKYVPTPIPEGVGLTGFFLHHEGMKSEPYYLLRNSEIGTYLKITNVISEADYFESIDTVLEEETAHQVLLNDTEVLQKLEEIISETGAVGWNGFNEKKSKKNVSDSGERYQLYMELSDGSTVSVYGYNTCPEGFETLLERAKKLFREYCAE